jgi:glutamate 5-kinase
MKTKTPIVIVKIGTNLLTTEKGNLDLNNLRNLVEQISKIHQSGEVQFLIVTSGGITCGSEQLKMEPASIPEKQAAAAVGQILLMKEYATFFGNQGIIVAQLLLTKDGMEDSTRCNHAKDTIFTLLKQNIIPIINENDVVATNEIGFAFGDNDELSSVLARTVKASRLILLTDTDGIQDRDPVTHALSHRIAEIETVDETILNLAHDSTNHRSRGGMKSKIIAAKAAAEAGISVFIADGRKPLIIQDILAGKPVGTHVRPVTRKGRLK